MPIKVKLPPKKKSGKKGRSGIANVKKARIANGQPKAPRKKNGPITRKRGDRIA